MPTIFRRDFHLASPIDHEELKYACYCKDRRRQKIPTRMKPEHKSLFKRFRVQEVRDGMHESKNLQATLLRHIQRNPAPSVKSKKSRATRKKAARFQPSATRQTLARGIMIAFRALAISFACMFQNTNYREDLPFDEQEVLTEEIVHLYHWRCYMEDLLGSGVQGTTKVYLKRYLGPNHRLEFFGNLLVYTDLNTRLRIVCTYNELLAVSSSISSQFYALLYCRIADLSNKYDHSLYDEYCLFREAALNDLHRYRNKAHDIYKALPSLAIAIINKQFDKLIDGSRFYNSMIEDLGHLRIAQLVKFMIKPLRDEQDIHIRLELSGLYKSFGYPIIDVEETLNYFHEYATAQPTTIDLTFCQRLRNSFKKYFIKQYFKEHDVFPPLSFTGPIAQPLAESIRKNQWREHSYESWDPDEFENLEIGKCLDFDYHEDESALLSDKSISGGRKYWFEEFDQDALYNYWGFRGKRSRVSKRLLVHYVTEPETKVKDTIELIEKEGGLPIDDCIMVGVEKEKENKIAGRVFGKTTRRARQYQTVTEWNLGHNLFKYMKNQSMNMTDKEFRTTLNDMNKPFSQHKNKRIFISFDFKKWCLTFTHEAATPIFEVIDGLFGLRGVYAYTHTFCQQALYIFQSRFAPPPVDPDGMPFPTKGSIYAMNKWLEGMRQKGWTVITSTLIEYTAASLNTKAQLMGQGDNQVICLEVPEHDVLASVAATPDQFAQHFIKVLEDHAAKIGLTLKPSETWASSNLFEYSKKYYYRGTEVSTALKTASKTGSLTNNDFNTVSNGVAGAFSSGVTIASSDNAPFAAYMLACVEACQVFFRHPLQLAFTDTEMVALLLSNRNVGGYPTVLFSSFGVRGMLDPLTSCIAIIRYCCAYHPDVFDCLARLLDFTPYNADPLLLIKDPLALAIQTPKSPEGLVRHLLRAGLEQVTRNAAIRPLFSVQTKIAEQQLVQDLFSMVPSNPKIMNALYKNSNVCIRDKLIHRFAASRSVRELLRRVVQLDETEFRELIVSFDFQMYRHYKRRLARPPQSVTNLFKHAPNLTCSIAVAQHLRALTWGKPIVGVSMPAMEEQVTLERWEYVEAGNHGYGFGIKVDEGVSTHTRGKHNPYIGSTTGKKTARASLSIIDNNSMTQSLQEILQLGPWMLAPGEENLAALLRTLYDEKTSIKMVEMEGLTRTIVGGSLTHRLRCDAIKYNTFWNALSVFNTHCYLNTDIMFKFAQTSTDYTLCMQSVMLISLARLSMLHAVGRDITGYHACVLECRSCTTEIPNEQHTLPATPQYPGIPLPNYVNKLHVKVRLHQLPDDYSRDPQFSYSTHIAWKWAKYLLSTSGGSLDSLPIHTTPTQTPVFCNLTEFSRVHVRTFLRTLSCSLLLSSESETEYERLLADLVYFNNLQSIKALYTTLCKCNLQGLVNDEMGDVMSSGLTFQLALHSYFLQNLSTCPDNKRFNGYFNLTPYQVTQTRDRADALCEQRRYTLAPCVVGPEAEASEMVRRHVKVPHPIPSVKRKLDQEFVPQEGEFLRAKRVKKSHYASSLEFDGDGTLGVTALRYLSLEIDTAYVVSMDDAEGIYIRQLLELGYTIGKIVVVPRRAKDYLAESHRHPIYVREACDTYTLTHDQILAWTDGTVPSAATLYICPSRSALDKVPIGSNVLLLAEDGEYNVHVIKDLNVYAYPQKWVYCTRTHSPTYITIRKSLSELLALSSSQSILRCIRMAKVPILHMDIVRNAFVKFFGVAVHPPAVCALIEQRNTYIVQCIESLSLHDLRESSRRERQLQYKSRKKQLEKLLTKLSNLIAVAATLVKRKIQIPPKVHIHNTKGGGLRICLGRQCHTKHHEVRGDIGMRSLNGFWLLSHEVDASSALDSVRRSWIHGTVEILDDYGYDPYVVEHARSQDLFTEGLDAYLERVFETFGDNVNEETFVMDY
ncbi:RNA-dependent RNA polymerase [Beihai rhabdo-like virus 5]|uniref:RNA-directed RNA polymerase n=1 Tax=Beihai rhabdo-like virus 5 TaxID=1922655 RepID=A0A1L3KMW2_9MONO|nr:RNA-dependent RNA polymerase [Beihai rhabdo-like virus 5]APG78645.1 RNA-dependent RNA polymerase [Beihai rhabdo-like virus 5]